jgi:hypothetical protein
MIHKKHNYKLLKDWRLMDTSRAQLLTDEQLIQRLEQAPINNGWGLVAELMKRYVAKS